MILNGGQLVYEVDVSSDDTSIDMETCLDEFKACLYIVICCVVHEEVCSWVLSRKRWLGWCLYDIRVGSRLWTALRTRVLAILTSCRDISRFRSRFPQHRQVSVPS